MAQKKNIDIKINSKSDKQLQVIDKDSAVQKKPKQNPGERLLKLQIWRFDPEKDSKPYMQKFEIDTTNVVGKMLLNVLEYIREELDPSLALRRSCGEGVCGSDGMNINGTNGLACITAIADLPDKIMLRPLPGLPVIKDLIVDMSRFYAQLAAVEPYLQNDTELPEKERLQSPEQRSKLDGLYECILCACCTSSCPSYWWNPDKFLGPAALLAARRFVADSRDTSAKQRLAALSGPFELYRCRTIMNCVRVCPKGLSPSHAIADLRRDMLQEEV